MLSMNVLPSIFRFKRLICGSALRNLRPSVNVTLNNANFSSVSPQLHFSRNPLLQTSKSFSNIRLCASTTATVPDYKKHSHTSVWVSERVVSVALLGILPLLWAEVPDEDFECIIDILIALHVHWGLEAIFTDYLRPSVVGKVIPKYCDYYAGFISIYLAVALLWISLYGKGVVNTIKHFWRLDPNFEK